MKKLPSCYLTGSFPMKFSPLHKHKGMQQLFHLICPLKGCMHTLIRTLMGPCRPLWSRHKLQESTAAASVWRTASTLHTQTIANPSVGDWGARSSRALQRCKVTFVPKMHFVFPRFEGEATAFVSCCFSRVACPEGSNAKVRLNWGCVRNVVGRATGWLRLPVHRAVFSLPPHCSTLSLEDPGLQQ